MFVVQVFLICVALICLVWVVFPYCIKRYSIQKLRNKCAKYGLLCLTYDDGPSHQVTIPIVELLDSYKVKATFYVLGNKLQSNKEVLSQIVEKGHAVGCHSYQHRNAWKSNPISVLIDIQKGVQSLGEHGLRPLLFRPPSGKVTFGNMLQAMFLKMKLGWWTLDSTDTWAPPSKINDIVKKVIDANGGVVLLHDHNRTENPDRHSYVIDLTRALLDAAFKNNIKLVTHEELLNRKLWP